MTIQALEQQFTDLRVQFRSRRPLPDQGPVVLWMQRAQRAYDNPAMDLAISVANQLNSPLAVFFAPRPDYPDAQLRHFTFLAQGIPELARDVTARGATFILRSPPHTSLTQFCTEVGARLVIGDENAMDFAEDWRRRAALQLRVSLWTVAADLIVPPRALPAQEFWAARSLRPKIAALLPIYLGLEHSQPPERVLHSWPDLPPPSEDPQDISGLLRRLGPIACQAGPVAWQGGRGAGLERLQSWIDKGLSRYTISRDEPSQDGTSALSPWLHFGQLGPAEVARAVERSQAPEDAKAAYLEQLIVRRELAWHFVARNPEFRTLAGCEPWARKTLAEHALDHRPFSYTFEQLESAQTHDPAWNAAQRQMVQTGWMHNRMRMYWAKQLLLWTPDPQTAMKFAQRLNDKWLLDGRDPNGYTGIAWSIGGKHDRPWPPAKPVWGWIRPMALSGLKKKTNLDAYLAQHPPLTAFSLT